MNNKRNTSVGPELQHVKKSKKNILLMGYMGLLLIGSLSITTQYFAYLFQYHAALGIHFNYIYPPWSILIWALKWSSQHPDEFRKTLILGTMILCMGMFIILIIKNMGRNSLKSNEFLHGSARWASEKDIQEAGLLHKYKWRFINKWLSTFGLMKSSGVYVGSWQDEKGTIHYLTHSGPEHILTYAPTRSGKGVGLVIPTLLSWGHSALITDLKGELWELTAGWRKKYGKNKVLRFEPAAAKGSVRWNPLAEIRIRTEYEVGDVQNLATLIVDPDGKGLENHWQKTAQALFVGLILHALYKDGNKATLASIDAMLSDPKNGIEKLWNEMTQYKHLDWKGYSRILMLSSSPVCQKSIEPDEKTIYLLKEHNNTIRPFIWSNDQWDDGKIFNLDAHWSKKIKNSKANDEFKDPETVDKVTLLCGYTPGKNHPVVGAAARDMLDRPEEEAGSVLSTAKSYLSLYRDPVVANNISASDFCIKDLMNHHNPVSLYIVTQPNDKMRLRPIVRMLVNMSLRLLADKMNFEKGRPKPHYKHRLLMLLDEFPSIGKLEIMQESLAYVAGYGIKCYLICQDINQLKSRETGYGPDETITSNCHIQNAYPPNRIETAEHLSKLTGETTIIKEQVTISGRAMGIIPRQVSTTYQETKRPLLTTDEALRMKGPKKDANGNIIEGGDMIIYVAGFPAIYGKQPLYFQDPIFQARAEIPAPKSDTLRKKEETIKL